MLIISVTRSILKGLYFKIIFQVKSTMEEIYDKLPEEFNVHDMMHKVEERTPFIIVAFQECERMNMLTREMKRSLREVALGLKGELTITSDMETLMEALYADSIFEEWQKKAYPSLLPLGLWVADLCKLLIIPLL